MSAARIPFSVASSLALHAGALGLYILATKTGPAATTHVIGGVDLMIQTHHAVELPKRAAAQAAPPPTLKDFFKLALPSIPKIEAQSIAVKTSETRKIMDVQPKLEERTRKAAEPQLAKLDLGSRRADAAMAKLEAKAESRRAALAQMPRLEDVGTHKVRNLPQALALEERRQAAVQQATIKGLDVENTHRHIEPAQALQEAEPTAAKRLSSKLADMLPAERRPSELREEMRPAPDDIAKKMNSYVAPPKPKRAAAGAMEEKRKGVEIEGPLKNRQVASAAIPPFPDQLRKLGTLEAEVRLNFCVSAEGDVVPSTIRPEQSSGYGWLDRSTTEYLKMWKFAPLGSSERQCGIITFRYELE
jgi:TonB family protein